MAITKYLAPAAIDAKLNYIKNNCTMVVYTSMANNPASNLAANITGVCFTRSGLTATDFTLVSGTSLTLAAGASDNATGTKSDAGAATALIYKTGVTATDGVILGITTTTTQMTSGQAYTPQALVITEGAAT